MKSRLLAPGVATLIATAACATSAPPAGGPAPAVSEPIRIVDTVRVETAAPVNAELESRAARLQIELLGRDVQLQELQQQLDETRQEVVRNMAKLQSQASRAEAASGIAEAEIALQALGAAPQGAELNEFAQAQDLVAQSSSEFGSENYGGALYLAAQARALARGGQARLRGGTDRTLLEGEARFAVPVPLRTTGRSNIRAGPGLNFPVAFTLDEGLRLTGYSYTSQWVRIEGENGSQGWIFHTLVTGSPR